MSWNLLELYPCVDVCRHVSFQLLVNDNYWSFDLEAVPL